jgi:hypothetical protein
VSRRPSSLVAERAVRYLRESGAPASSTRLARELLTLSVGDESQATLVLDTAFGDDPRLAYDGGAWRIAPPAAVEAGIAAPPEPDVAFVLVEGAREAKHAPLRLTAISAVRRRGDQVVAACGGALALWPPGSALREELRALLDGAHVVLHAPPGGQAAVEGWLEEPLDDPLPLSLLARRRRGAPARQSIEELAASLGLAVRVEDDPAQRVEIVPACFDALRQRGEPWSSLAEACRSGGPALPWARYAFTREDLRAVPPVPGTYRFYDPDEKLLYVGKSANLRRRLAAWFKDDGPRSARVRALVEAVHRFELRPSGSELAALLREAAQIRRDLPERNVQREVHPRGARAARLGSILILEPAEAPWTLRAWLIRDGRLLDAIPLGPRGGGLKRITRVLEGSFFDSRSGPTSARAREVDVELIARWLGEHRDKAVAFDPTHLRTADEVVARLRLFLDRGTLVDPEGSPILPR